MSWGRALPLARYTSPVDERQTRTGWYLISANGWVESGPFLTEGAAAAEAARMDDEGLGRFSAPWRCQFSRTGLKIGARWRASRPRRAKTPAPLPTRQPAV